MALAKVQEQKIQFKKVSPKLFSPYPPILPIPTHYPPSNFTPKPVNTTSSHTPTINNPPKTNIQKLSQSQIQAKREKGLCFYCDEKYTFGHKCKASVHVLIVPDSEETLDDEELGKEDTVIVVSGHDKGDMVVSTPQISFHAMLGVFFPQTLRFKASIIDV